MGHSLAVRGVLTIALGLLLGWALFAAGPGGADHGSTHTITVQVTGQGTVTDDEGEISCPSDCTGSYDETTSFVQLTAAPSTGYRFDTWTNCPSEDGDTCDVDLAADSYVIGARFVTEATPPPPPAPPPTPTQRTLTVRVVGPGTVQSDPTGIACGSDCVENFPTNALVVVTAVPADGAEFTGWSGDCVGTGASCAITMSTARSLTATFRLPPPALRLTAPGASVMTANGNQASAAVSDVLLYETGRASVVLDGSDVGLGTTAEAVDAVAFLSDGSLLVSTVGAASVQADYRTTAAGRGATLAARGEDVLRFKFTRTGETSRGTWSMYLDGSDIGLTAASENIDALATAGRQLLVSTSGAVSVKGAAAAGEDVLRFRPARFGETSRGTWGVYFDGSDVGLGGLAENVVGLDVTGSTLTLVTSGPFSATGASGDAGDLVRATCSRLGATTACRFVTLVTANDLDLGGSRAGSIDLR
jgi:hypothetical protein